ncbi:leucine--tRNA ligase [Candidatus Dependentiae bacterium]|nr:leucine--tRNA ligase [Candidatus Dependentiae bacterium]
MKYDFQVIEKKWRGYWKKNPYFKTKIDKTLKKYYVLDMFPYPSGSGIHVGHWKNYVLSDVYARIKWHEGYNVLHPMGWDAFGLPAENYAIKQGIHPKISTEQNIKNFKEQLDQIGAIYDWEKELNTTDPSYYKWTQWIFLQMYNAGLAYEDFMPINWCPKCLTGLANEEVVGGECDRCGAEVEQRKIRQWVLRITKYADRLLNDLDDLDWPERVKLMQKNWIGKSYGARVLFKVNEIELPVFTTRPDTIFGATFMVIAPDHESIDSIVTDEQLGAVQAYQEEVAHMSDLDRTAENQEKTGVFTGAHAINPVNGEAIPVYISSYVLSSYGTGAIMAVPAHDQRDFAFAKRFGLQVRQVIKPTDLESEDGYYEDDGVLVNSGPFDGLDAKTDGFNQIVNELEKLSLGKREVCYRLRDWIFSRQRYWGEPIPLVHCEVCGVVSVPEDQLPIKLPEVESYEPTGTGESPLAAIDWWVNTDCPKCGGKAKRETNTMPQWAGSCWYFLRYPNPGCVDKPFTQEDMDYWMPVDLYVGGIEHAILHLLYARFYIKVLYDLGHLSFDEPFKKLFNQGMICMYSEKSGRVEKMSKSKGNVVNPDDIIGMFGADSLRMYMLFIGPPEMDCEWKMEAIKGIKNFLNRLWDFLTDPSNIVANDASVSEKSIKRFHRFLKEYQERVELFKVNTAVASMMEYLNDMRGQRLQLNKQMVEQFLTAASIMIPHFASELLEQLVGKNLSDCVWPQYDPLLAAQDEVEFAIQVNGKLRGTLVASKGVTQEVVRLDAEKIIAKWLDGKEVVKVVFVPNRLISFVVK